MQKLLRTNRMLDNGRVLLRGRRGVRQRAQQRDQSVNVGAEHSLGQRHLLEADEKVDVARGVHLQRVTAHQHRLSTYMCIHADH